MKLNELCFDESNKPVVRSIASFTLAPPQLTLPTSLTAVHLTFIDLISSNLFTYLASISLNPHPSHHPLSPQIAIHPSS